MKDEEQTCDFPALGACGMNGGCDWLILLSGSLSCD